MDFGLGLILSFTDNASAGINNAVNSLDRLTQTAQGAASSLNGMASLSALSVVAGQMGQSFTSAGTSILGVFTNLLGHVKETGQDFENFRITLDALYGQDFPNIEERTKHVNSQLQKLLDFSVKSPFEVNDVKEMLIVLKSQGIDAFQELQGAVTGTRQETLAWIADMMAFKPEVSAERWKLAFQNYIGSGESKILRNALDMGKIEDILGHDIGKTTEERMNDIMEIIEKKGLTGLAEKLSTTWSGVASNVSDAFTKLYKVIADNGVFDALKSSFMGLAGVITTLEPDDLNALGKALADGLNMVVAPIVKVVGWVNKLVLGFVDLVKQNPAIAKFAVVLGVVSGALLVFVGLALKATSALSGVALMYMAFGQSFNSIGALFRAGALKIMGVLIPLGLAIAALYAVWKTDFAGIRSTITSFVTNTVASFKTAKTAVSGSLADMKKAISGLDIKNNFFDGLTYAVMRLMTVGKALVEGWNNYTLSDDTFQKARELGVLPLIEALFMFLYRFRLFKEGFIEGWNNISTAIRNVIGGILQAVDGTVFESMFQGLSNFLELLVNNDPQAWKDFGVFLGEIAAKAVAFGIAFKAAKMVLSPIVSIVLKVVGAFKTLFNLFGGVGKFVGTVIRSFSEVITLMRGGMIAPVTKLGQLFVKLGGFISKVAGIATKIGGVFTHLGSVISGVLTAISGAIGIPVAGVAAIVIAVIGSIVAFAVTARDKFVALFSGLWEHIKGIFSSIAERFRMVVDLVKGFCAPAFAMISGAIDNIKAAIGRLTSSGTLRAILAAIVRVLSFIGELIMGTIVPALRLIASVIGGVVKAAIDVFGGAIAGVFTAISGVISGVINVISGLINILTGIFNTIGGLIKGILTGDWSTFTEGLKSIGTGILEFFGGIIEAIGGVIGGIVGVIGGLVGGVFDLGVSIVTGLIDGIASFIGNAVTAVVDFFKSILDAIKNFLGIHSPSTVFAEIGGFLIEGLLQGIMNLWNTVTTFLTSAFSGIISAAQSIWGGITSVFSGAVSFFSGIFNSIYTVVSGVFTSIGNFFNTVWNGIVTTFSTLGDTISGVVRGAINSVLGFATNVINGFIRAINFAIDIINAIPGVSISKLTELSVPQLAMGGIVTQPTTAIIGEAGAEAVMPLENNKQWIGLLAKDITDNMNNLTPVSSQTYNNSNTATYEGANTQEYLTTNSGGTSNDNSQYDQRTVFSEGSIVVQVQNASEEEAERLANMVMEKIKRKQELENMRNYKPAY